MFSVTAFPAVIVAPVMTTACGCAWFAATTPLISAGGAVGVVGVELLLPQATSVMVMTQPARIANAASSVNSRLESAVPDSISFRSCDIVVVAEPAGTTRRQHESGDITIDPDAAHDELDARVVAVDDHRLDLPVRPQFERIGLVRGADGGDHPQRVALHDIVAPLTAV